MVPQRTFNKWFLKAPFMVPDEHKEFFKEPIKVPRGSSVGDGSSWNHNTS